jgi:hypothetical protein
MTYFVTPIHLEWNSMLKSQISKILIRIQVPIMFWTLKVHCENGYIFVKNNYTYVLIDKPLILNQV